MERPNPKRAPSMPAPVAGAGRLVRALGGGDRGRVIWAATAVVAAVVLLACTWMQSRARDDEAARAERRAVRTVRTTLFPALSASELSAPVDGRALRELRAGFTDDPTIGAVHIWRRDGRPIFSTGARGISARDTGMREPFRDAIRGETTTVRTTVRIPPGDGLDPVDTEVLRTITPVRVPKAERVLGAAAVSTYSSAVDDAAAQPWKTLRIAFGIVLLCAVLLLYVAVRWPDPEG